ncbi:GSCFA domain-containing protein [uncultured Algibacter sp.]|uniref:GSCFA domain-containing protein n=1 Tax=uncultured Algibacter sp. TaxID=298659 RepID=UPI003217CABB
MNLQTKIKLEKQSKHLIDYNSSVLLLGSCFSENIGEKLEYFKFQNLQNPFGILFHPKSIELLIEDVVNKKQYLEDDVFYYNEQWHSFKAHSKLSHTSKEVLLKMLNAHIALTHQYIKNATHIVITLGTAWVYNHLESNLVVANCHKLPQKQFEKKILTVSDIATSLKNIIDGITSLNAMATVVFTVSPVRHLKDGFIENTQSKAHLISAIHEVLNQKSNISNSQLFYFPSYEIMMDELRDYRFYKADMLHPNQTAIHYIWDKFNQVWIADKTIQTMDTVDAVQKGLQHKPFNPDSEAHQKFIKHLEAKKATLTSQFPYIKF